MNNLKKSNLKRILFDAIILLIGSGLIIFIDTYVKNWSYTVLYEDYGGKKDFIPHLVSLFYAENTGAAWSILEDAPWVFMILSSLLIIALIVYWFCEKSRNVLLRISLLMITGGGAGNMIDRLFRTGSRFGNRNGFVIDMFNFEFIDFPVFNVADICVTVGAFLLVVYLLVYEIILAKKKAVITNE